MRAAGRLMVYSANFGTISGNAQWGATGMRSLQSIPGHVLIGQEMDGAMYDALAAGGWLLTDKSFAPAGPRTRFTPQLLVALWPTHGESIRTLGGRNSWSLFGENDRGTHALFAEVSFKWRMAGFKSMVVGNFHLHRDVAGADPKRSPYMVQFFDRMAESIRASGARVLGGDANKALFVIAPMLAERGIEAFLMGHHVELDPTVPLRAHDAESVSASLRYDSCGIWLLGPRGITKPLAADSRVVLGAMHAFYLEVQRGQPQGPSRQRGAVCGPLQGVPGVHLLWRRGAAGVAGSDCRRRPSGLECPPGAAAQRQGGCMALRVREHGSAVAA